MNSSGSPFVPHVPDLEPMAESVDGASEGNTRKRPVYGGHDTATGSSKSQLPKRSLVMVNAAAGLDGCDDQILPSSFRAMEHDLGFHPSRLGQIALVQALALSCSCPIWGYLADRISRKRILCFGCTFWGVTTVFLATASDFWQILLLRVANGFLMGSVGPISQSILADASSSGTRGLVFGLVQTSANCGRVIGGVLTTAVGLTVFWDVSGWRWSVGGVGILSVLLGLLIALFLPPVPRRSSSVMTSSDLEYLDKRSFARHQLNSSEFSGSSIAVLSEEVEPLLLSPSQVPCSVFLREVFSMSLASKTVRLLFLEGCCGMVPWSALSFTTMYFQYCGLSDLKAGIVNGGMLFGAMAGGPIGGYIGDILSTSVSKNRGRPFIAQISMICRIPLLYLIFHLICRDPKSFVKFSMAAFGLGLCSFAGPAVHRPILADMVLPEHRATVFSIAIAFEGVCSSLLGAPLVGLLAEKYFGYVKSGDLVSEQPAFVRQRNAAALARALLWVTIIPWIVSFLIYTTLHFTYAHDKLNIDHLARQRSFARLGIPFPSKPNSTGVTNPLSSIKYSGEASGSSESIGTSSAGSPPHPTL